MDLDRQLTLEYVFNFRDLGGLQNSSRQRITRGVIFRSDALHQASELDIGTLAALGLRTVIDLRTEREQNQYGIVDATAIGASLVHLPLISTLWPLDGVDHTTDPVPYLVERYHEMTDGLPAVVPLIVRSVADDDATIPLAFHCAAGKDRTGVIAAILLAVLGVSTADIAHDYHLTSAAMPAMMAWRASQRAAREAAGTADAFDSMVDHPPAFVTCPPDAMTIFLTELLEQSGGAAALANSMGIDADSLARFRFRMTS